MREVQVRRVTGGAFQSVQPWRSNRYGQRADSSASLWWGPKTTALEHLAGGSKQLAQEIEDLQRKHAPPTWPRQPDAWQALTRAKGHHQKAQKWLLECEDALERLVILHDEALLRRDQALKDAHDADQEADEKLAVQTPLDFLVDDRLLDAKLDDCEDGPEKEGVLALRATVAEIQQAGRSPTQRVEAAEAGARRAAGGDRARG
ncbi:unnamed protein product, partial [Prorocentrum cordatum]